jgi:hypothetical protein
MELSIELFLIHEAARGNASSWAPYIAMLPTNVPLSWRFTDAELNALQDESVIKTARDKRRTVQTKYDKAKLDIKAFLAAIPGLRSEDAAYWGSFEAFSWAMSITASRVTSLKGELYLVPFADMIDYSPSKVPGYTAVFGRCLTDPYVLFLCFFASQTFREATGGSHFLRYHRVVELTEDDRGTFGDAAIASTGYGGAVIPTFQVLADQDIVSGGVIAEDYGDAANYVYLHHHGFLPAYNPFDCVHVLLQPLHRRPTSLPIQPPSSWLSSLTSRFSGDASKTVRMLASKDDHESMLDGLQLRGLSVPSVCLRPEPLPLHVQQYLQFRYMSPEDAGKCMAVVASYIGTTNSNRAQQLSEDALTEARGRCLDGRPLPAEAWQELIDSAQAVLDSFPTTEENDAMLLRMASRACKRGGVEDGNAKCDPLFFQLSEHEL